MCCSAFIEVNINERLTPVSAHCAAVVAVFIRLIPLDVYLWGYLKDRIYAHNPQSIPDFKTETTATIKAIPREECKKVIQNVACMIQVFLQRQEAHFKHICLALVNQRFFIVKPLKFSDFLNTACYTYVGEIL